MLNCLFEKGIIPYKEWTCGVVGLTASPYNAKWVPSLRFAGMRSCQNQGARPMMADSCRSLLFCYPIWVLGPFWGKLASLPSRLWKHTKDNSQMSMSPPKKKVYASQVTESCFVGRFSYSCAFLQKAPKIPRETCPPRAAWMFFIFD